MRQGLFVIIQADFELTFSFLFLPSNGITGVLKPHLAFNTDFNGKPLLWSNTLKFLISQSWGDGSGL